MSVIKWSPSIFAVEDQYEIFIAVAEKCLMWITAGGKRYEDAFCGIRRSLCSVHRFTVPMAVLDDAKEYTVHWRIMRDRKPYFPESEEEETAHFVFRPVTDKEELHLYMLADTHGQFDKPFRAAEYFPDIDCLILCGDIPDYCSEEERIFLIYRLTGEITKGEIPALFVRGNHDDRGLLAERLDEYIPLANGNTFYHFRLGPVSGLALDTGEDKPDNIEEYGNTTCFDAFRQKETVFLEDFAASGIWDDPGIQYRLVVCHNPFSSVKEPPFDVDKDRFSVWTELLRPLHPDIMLSGHCHFLAAWTEDDLSAKGGSYPVPCPVISGTEVDYGGSYYTGCAVILRRDGICVRFTNHEKKVLQEHLFPRYSAKK